MKKGKSTKLEMLTYSVHVRTKWWWKRVDVGDEELTNSYIIVVVASE